MPAPKNLVHQTSSTTGTGNFTLVAVNGKVTFADSTYGFGTGGTDLFDYFISNRDATEWERGTGHMSDSTTLVRDTVIESSNANAAVSFSAGTKDVTNDIPAAKQVTTDTTQTLTNKTLTAPVISTISNTGTITLPTSTDTLVGKATTDTLSNKTFPNTGLNVLDANASHTLGIVPGSDLSANRTLTVTTGDANRTLTISADSTIAGTALVLGTEDQGPITGGASVTSKDLGTISSGTTTLDYSDRPLQYYTNGGPHTLAADSADGYCVVLITNNGSAGTITLSGFDYSFGDSFTTTNTHKFRVACERINGTNIANIKAIQ